MRAITVSVGYGEILARTLKYNRHHFSEVMVVTTPHDFDTIKAAISNGAELYTTERFYERGAHFNKWGALEEGLERFGRHGLMCIMDADVLWPRNARHDYQRGLMYSPRRRVQLVADNEYTEGMWSLLPIHEEAEFCGYTQIFYAEDPVLTRRPWFGDWKCAGGGDSEFAFRWPESDKRRPSWECVHLGEPMKNWCGIGNEAELEKLLKQRNIMKAWKLK